MPSNENSAADSDERELVPIPQNVSQQSLQQNPPAMHQSMPPQNMVPQNMNMNMPPQNMQPQYMQQMPPQNMQQMQQMLQAQQYQNMQYMQNLQNMQSMQNMMSMNPMMGGNPMMGMPMNSMAMPMMGGGMMMPQQNNFALPLNNAQQQQCNFVLPQSNFPQQQNNVPQQTSVRPPGVPAHAIFDPVTKQWMQWRKKNKTEQHRSLQASVEEIDDEDEQDDDLSTLAATLQGGMTFASTASSSEQAMPADGKPAQNTPPENEPTANKPAENKPADAKARSAAYASNLVWQEQRSALMKTKREHKALANVTLNQIQFLRIDPCGNEYLNSDDTAPFPKKGSEGAQKSFMEIHGNSACCAGCRAMQAPCTHVANCARCRTLGVKCLFTFCPEGQDCTFGAKCTFAHEGRFVPLNKKATGKTESELKAEHVFQLPVNSKQELDAKFPGYLGSFGSKGNTIRAEATGALDPPALGSGHPWSQKNKLGYKTQNKAPMP